MAVMGSGPVTVAGKATTCFITIYRKNMEIV